MRVLVVEDDPRLLRNLAKVLREEGYAVDTADTGTEGIYKAENWQYDAIILDVMLPEMDGWEILKRLRTQKTTPVLMLTARDAFTDRVRGLDSGADDYLVKPFDLPELLARVRALIRRAAGQSTSIIEIGDVRVDTRGRSVTRTTLYEHLFDENDFTLSNLLDVHVFSIRKKLGSELITTHRGQGYSINV